MAENPDLVNPDGVGAMGGALEEDSPRDSMSDGVVHRMEPVKPVIKGIGLMSSVALIFNNITGPALAELPVVFQRAGYLSVFFTIAVTYVLCHFASHMMVEIVACMPKDESGSPPEYSTCLKYYFGQHSNIFKVCHVVLFCYLQSVNVAMIAQSSQMFDMLTVYVFGRSCGLEIVPPSFVCASEKHNTSPFGNNCILSMGFALTAILALPMAYLRLEENKGVQVGSFILILVTVLFWSFAFIFNDGADTSRVPAVGKDQSEVVGTILFSYAMVTTIPSWLSEKANEVDVRLVVSQSLSWATAAYVAVGVLGGWAYKFTGDQQLLQAINEKGPSILKVSVYLFPLLVNVPSIPIFSIISRYNLVDSKLCSNQTALFLSLGFPWVFSILAYKGDGMEQLVNMSGVYLSGAVNFVLPFWMYRRLALAREEVLERDRRKTDRLDDGAMNNPVDMELSDNMPLLGEHNQEYGDYDEFGGDHGDICCPPGWAPQDRDVVMDPSFRALPPQLEPHAKEVALICLGAFGVALALVTGQYITDAIEVVGDVVGDK